MENSVQLDCRGARFSIERENLMSLPESILLCLFPNGVVLNPVRTAGQEDSDQIDEQPAEEDVYFVDFDGACLDYILKFFDSARDDFYGTSSSPKRPVQDPSESLPSSPSSQNPLFHKQAIIVLREELEYFAIPPKKAALEGDAVDATHPATDEEGFPNAALLQLKRQCGKSLLERHSIFTALQRNVNRENNVAEQHLIDMLCMSGFDREDTWGYRAVEPNRCCITSIALVLLKTGINHNSTSSESNGTDQSRVMPSVNAAQLATAQKLLLFWRKPARKCWWDASEIELPSQSGSPASTVKVWARRIWTLELTLL